MIYVNIISYSIEWKDTNTRIEFYYENLFNIINKTYQYQKNN
jgi:hypothetical protein